MKIIIYLITLSLSSFVLAAERPSSVPSKITELKSKNWYREAANEWEEYLNTNSSDAIGWVEYYKAATFSGQPASALASIADKVQELYPESFASYYVGFQHEGWTTKGLELLDLALKIESSRTICLEDQLIRSELMGALLDRKLTSEAVYEAGLIHSSTLNYNYNLLMSVGEGGLLITDGLHTTVPIWVLQDVMNVRKDVSVLNLRLARSQPEYLDRVLAQKNLESSIEELLSEEHGQNIYYALTMPRNRLQKLESRLYVVGLASTSGSEDFKHFETLRTNIEEKFLMDYLTIDFNGEPKTATGNMLSANYIVPLLLLKEFYDNLDKPERSETLKNQILALAADSEIETRVQLLLSQRKTHTTFKPVELDIKDLEKHLNQIKGQLYASDVELDNKSYWAYMEYLRKNGYTELYEQGLPDLSKYDVITKAWLSNYFYSPENVKALNAKRKLGDYQDYPVLDITYENAKAYCEWLTVQYNAQEKKKYKKVLFRLPSKKEWTMAALGYKKFTSWNLEENTIELKTKEGNTSYSLAEYKITYPWGIHAWSLRNSITNDKDCYLANVDVGEDIICGAGIKGDGFVLPSPVGTYFANGLGLYDVVGNVAEMVDEEGIAMGGSWNHPEEESTILSENSYEGSDISVGFRLFMEVIEE